MIYRESKNIRNPLPYSILIPFSRSDVALYHRLSDHVICWLEQNIGEKNIDWLLKIYYGDRYCRSLGKQFYNGYIAVKFNSTENAMAFMLTWK